MPRTDNYPDDIRQYDHDPRSPFYVEVAEDIEDDEERAEAIRMRERYEEDKAEAMYEDYYI